MAAWGVVGSSGSSVEVSSKIRSAGSGEAGGVDCTGLLGTGPVWELASGPADTKKNTVNAVSSLNNSSKCKQ